MNKLLLLGIFFISMSLPSYAQFIGIKIGIPSMIFKGGGAGGGGGVANAMTFNGATMTFNGATMTFTHS